jgi:hypothetical protein
MKKSIISLFVVSLVFLACPVEKSHFVGTLDKVVMEKEYDKESGEIITIYYAVVDNCYYEIDTMDYFDYVRIGRVQVTVTEYEDDETGLISYGLSSAPQE